jgi:hypothetical protein
MSWFKNGDGVSWDIIIRVTYIFYRCTYRLFML